MALPRSKIEEWKKLKFLDMDGYRSTSLKLAVARLFAENAESDDKDKVILKINFENKSGKYYICLDRPDYSMYLEESEVLFQAGLTAKIVDF